MKAASGGQRKSSDIFLFKSLRKKANNLYLLVLQREAWDCDCGDLTQTESTTL